MSAANRSGSGQGGAGPGGGGHDSAGHDGAGRDGAGQGEERPDSKAQDGAVAGGAGVRGADAGGARSDGRFEGVAAEGAGSGDAPRPAFAPGRLRTGDVLLIRAQGPLAALTAWFGESQYSHVALVGRAGYLIEVAAGGVVELPLALRLLDPSIQAIDACRPLDAAAQPLGDTDRIAVLAHALSLRRPAFAGDAFGALGRLVALRDRELPPSPMLRLALREALEHAAQDATAAMSASEFVYRCFAENTAQPRGRLAPVLDPVARAGAAAPWPDPDWRRFWREIAPWLRPARREALGLGEDGALGHAGLEQDEYAAALAQARQRLGLIATGAAFLAAAGPRLPNPRWVRLRDLERSPSYQRLGRLQVSTEPS